MEPSEGSGMSASFPMPKTTKSAMLCSMQTASFAEAGIPALWTWPLCKSVPFWSPPLANLNKNTWPGIGKSIGVGPLSNKINWRLLNPAGLNHTLFLCQFQQVKSGLGLKTGCAMLRARNNMRIRFGIRAPSPRCVRPKSTAPAAVNCRYDGR